MPLKSWSIFSQVWRPPTLYSSLQKTSRLFVMSEVLHVRARHPSISENTIPFPHAPSISRQSLSLTSTDIGDIGYSYSQAYASLSHDSNATYQARLSRTPAGSVRSMRSRPGAKQLSPVAEEREERRRSRGSRSYTSSLVTHRSSSIPVPLSGPPVVEIFPEDITEAIMSLLPRVEARTAAIARHRSRRPRLLRALVPVKRIAKAAGSVITGAAKAIPTLCLKHRY
ncbi:hypothetical protein F5148DRAFT_6368 [Russula earlei]|uniref:Uncharacterized protein n=1 Tax=Russula earlei TaxID=71964 RepID=A0ACC0UP30_9AGAM|nr:hypothetical protein F5148DRAFT_6368 [Russula earlei]